MDGGLWRDTLVGVRQFRRSPGLAAGVALTIGLGVGANLAVVALLSDAFFPSTPYRDASQLVMVENTGPYYYGGSLPEGLSSPQLSMPDFGDLLAGQRSLAAVGGYRDTHITVMTGGVRPLAVCRIYVTSGLFETLGMGAASGRLLGAGDFAPGAPPVALVTDGLWHSALASDPRVVGRTLHLDEQPFTMVGVIPAGVFGLLQQRARLLEEGRVDRCVVTPLVAGAAGNDESVLKRQLTMRDSPALKVLGRLRPGQTPASVNADLTDLASRIREQNHATNARRGLRAVALDEWRTSEVRPLLLMLAAAAALVFLVACANAAGLVLTDTIGRQAELGIRQALGAGFSQLVGLVLVRAVLWSLPGAVLGFLFAEGTVAAIRWGAAAGAGEVAGVSVGPTVIGAGLAMTLLAGLASGAVAAWSLRRRNLVEELREGGQTTSGGRRRHRVTFALVALQVAAATALSVGAALLVHSMWNVVSADRGFDIDKGFSLQVRLPRSKYPTSAASVDFYRKALARIRALPGVASAGISTSPPLTDTSVMLSGGLEVATPEGKKSLNRLSGQFVTPGYFESLGMRLVRGCFFTEADDQAGAAVAVVDEAFVRTHLGGADPLASTLPDRRSGHAGATAMRQTVRQTDSSGRVWWHHALHGAPYDRGAALSDVERCAIGDLLPNLVAHGDPDAQRRGLQSTELARLLRPMHDAFTAMDSHPTDQRAAIRILLDTCVKRECTYWGWTPADWVAVLGATSLEFRARQRPRVSQSVRLDLTGFAYLHMCFRDVLALGHFTRVALARRVFGREAVATAIAAVATPLAQWGYAVDTALESCLCEALLLNESPALDHLDRGRLDDFRRRADFGKASRYFQVARALAAQGILDAPLAVASSRTATQPTRCDTGVSPEWKMWVERWAHTSTLVKIEDLPALHPIRHLVGQRPPAACAAVDRMPYRVIGRRHHPQGLARMPGLAASGTSAGRAQTLRCGLGEAIGGRRLAAVGGILRHLFFHVSDAPFAGLEAHGQVLDVAFQRVNPCVHRQQHAHDGVFARAIDGLRLGAGQHARTARSRSSTSG